LVAARAVEELIIDLIGQFGKIEGKEKGVCQVVEDVFFDIKLKGF